MWARELVRGGGKEEEVSDKVDEGWDERAGGVGGESETGLREKEEAAVKESGWL